MCACLNLDLSKKGKKKTQHILNHSCDIKNEYTTSPLKVAPSSYIEGAEKWNLNIEESPSLRR